MPQADVVLKGLEPYGAVALVAIVHATIAGYLLLRRLLARRDVRLAKIAARKELRLAELQQRRPA